MTLRSSLNELESIIHKVIYVDSASADNSVSVAKRFCNLVIKLDESEGLCASFGRKVGAEQTEREWVLFLDGDMTVTKEFREWLMHFDHNTDWDGFVGTYKDIDRERNLIKYRNFKIKKGIAQYFGGAVLLKRQSLFEAGNWSSHIFSNEEIELYSRMWKKGFRIKNLEIIMVHHYTRIFTVKEDLLDIILVRNKNNSKGPSQVLLKSIQENYFKELLYLQHMPYMMFFINIITIVLGIFSYRVALTWFIMTHLVLIIIKKNLKEIILGYLSKYLLIVGLLLHVEDFIKRKFKFN